MPRKTIIFGNGIGMALDPEYFSLDNSIGEIWENGSLDGPQKNLICQCLPNDDFDRPHGENELAILQMALSACEFLDDINRGDFHWLTENGQSFPKAIRSFIYQVSARFHFYDSQLDNNFIDPLAAFLRDTNSHIATLNYDNLLYSPLVNRNILSGYAGNLVDGFHANTTGFNEDHLVRKYGNDFGYYLHLHGSPLFEDSGKLIYKMNQYDLSQDVDSEDLDNLGSHIVLTHVDHKPEVIASSYLLDTYWQFLISALKESEEIILFGYSGLDKHLNSRIRRFSDQQRIKVVEWSGTGDGRDWYWSKKFDNQVEYIALDSILDFTDW